MAQSNNSARGGIRGFLANNGNRTGNGFTRTVDRFNVLPGMDERGNFSWEEFRSDLGRTAANMMFPGLGSLIGMGRNNGWNLRNIGGAISGTAGAVGRLFDGNPNTGFWNYGAAPWNMSPDGSPNFMGPPSNLAPGGSFGGGGGGSSGFGPSSNGPSGGWNSPTGSWINTHGNNGNPQWGLGWLGNINPSPSYSGPAPGSPGYGVVAPGGGGGGEGGSGGASSGGNRGMTSGSTYGGQGWDPRSLHWILRGR